MRFSLVRPIRAIVFASTLLLFCYLLVPRSYRPPTKAYVDVALSSIPDLPDLSDLRSLPDWAPWDSDGDDKNANRAAAVREAFIHGWEGYRAHAFPHDMLLPLTNGYEDDRSGWGCTAVDALTAGILLEVPEMVETAVSHIATINWDIVTSPKVAIFGSTIRYLGSMLSAYDLLTSTHTSLTSNMASDAVQILLAQSQSLANALSVSFSTPTGINHNQLIFPEHSITKGSTNDITAISGLPLEWTHLSDLTGNGTYARLAQNSMKPLLKPNPRNPSPYPGLLPKHINTDTGIIDTTDTGGWSHAGGGLYEMYLKLSVYDPVRFASYRKQWVLAADSTMKYLASHPKGRPDLTFLADFNGTELIYHADHSGSFAAASFILGGAVTGETKYLQFGLELVKTYVEMYRSTPTGLGPESWGWIPDFCEKVKNEKEGDIAAGLSPDPEKKMQAKVGKVAEKAKQNEVEEEMHGTLLAAQRLLTGAQHGDGCILPDEYASKTKDGFTEQNGYFMTNTGYRLRPEVLESLYYAYRVTGDQIYRDWSWEIFVHINQTCRAGSAFAEIKDVNVIPTPGKNTGRHDRMFSYALAEVMMYAYIIHLDDAPWQMKSDDSNEWVFSTEGHPIKVASKTRR